MKLSVIIPFCKELDLINRTINSVLINSTFFEEVEIILINDSLIKESQIRILFDNNTNKLVKIISNINTKGPGGARNTGLKISNGDIIAFLDADDFWLPGKLKAQMREIKNGATFVATSYRFDNAKIKITPPKSIDKPEDVFLRRGIGTSTVVITKELLENHKFKDIRFGQDIDFWFVLANSKKFKYAGVAEVFVEYNTSGSTKNKWIQLFYLNKILSLNKINMLTRIKVNISYILIGIYNHYIKKFLFVSKNS
jgi:glycosyltransferase involved in cell wall biosynthesis